MNKKFRTIMSKVILGVSLGVITATTAIPTTSAYAEYNQSNLSMQTIYTQDGFTIAKVNASQDALNKCIYMICTSNDVSDYKVYDTGYAYENTHYFNYYYDANNKTKYYDDGTIVTVSENENPDYKYTVTFKIPKNVFKDPSSAKAIFENESIGGQNSTSYEDTNNGNGYSL